MPLAATIAAASRIDEVFMVNSLGLESCRGKNGEKRGESAINYSDHFLHDANRPLASRQVCFLAVVAQALKWPLLSRHRIAAGAAATFAGAAIRLALADGITVFVLAGTATDLVLEIVAGAVLCVAGAMGAAMAVMPSRLKASATGIRKRIGESPWWYPLRRG
ncbi:hypothetical protein [Thermomonas sp.]